MKKVSIFLFLLGIILLGAGCYFVVFRSNKINKEIVPKIEINSFGEVNPCLDTSNCQPFAIVEYPNISYSSGTAIDSKIEKINQDTKKYYQTAIDSDVSDGSCVSVNTIYNHSRQTFSDLYEYHNDDYLAFAISRIDINLCANLKDSQQMESYVYSIKEEKLLTQEELKESLQISNEDLKEAITQTIDEYNSSAGTSVTIDEIDLNDTVVFFNGSGEVVVSYPWVDNISYFTAIVLEADS